MEVSLGGSQSRFRRYGKEVRAAKLVNNVLRLPHGFLGDYLLPLYFHPNYSLLEDFILRNLRVVVSKEDVDSKERDGDVGAEDEEDVSAKEEEDVDAMEVEEVEVKGKRQFHLVATPGIGKTYFGHYWFFKEAKLKHRVIWRTKGDGVFLYYDFSLKDPFVHAAKDYVVPVAWDADMETIWLVVDGECKGVSHNGPVLQCVSPGRSGYHEFAKDVGVLCHLEAWTLGELMECRDSLKLKFTDAELTLRYHFCGGMPREVFDGSKSIDDLKDTMMKAASRAPSWEAVIRHAAADADKDPLISDYLLHYQLPKDLDMNAVASDKVRRYTLKFGSLFVEDLVVGLYERQGHEKVREFFDFCQGIPVAHELAGKFFERHVHRQLRDGGGEYKVKDLVAPETPTSILSIKPTSSKRLRRYEIAKDSAQLSSRPRKPSKAERLRGLVEVLFSVYHQQTAAEDAQLGREESKGLASLDEGCFVEPYSATFKSLDSFVTPHIMIQCTYSLEHKVFWAPILEIVQEYDRWFKCRCRDPPAFYMLIFVVPESQFKDFKFQAYKKEDGTVYEQAQPEMSRVRQFALSFPW